MDLVSRLQLLLSVQPGHIVLRRDLANLASKSHLNSAINRLIALGLLLRLRPGVFARAARDRKGEIRLLSEPQVLAEEASRKLGRDVQIVKAGPGGNWQAIFSTHSGRQPSRRKLGALPQELDRLPTQHVHAYVRQLASAHGVQYRRTGLDDFAEDVTRAAGDEVTLDTTNKLLVALRKKNVIDGPQLARLTTNHLRETKRVRSVRGL